MIDNWLDVIFWLAVLFLFLYAWLCNTEAGGEIGDSTRIKDSRDQMGMAAGQ